MAYVAAKLYGIYKLIAAAYRCQLQGFSTVLRLTTSRSHCVSVLTRIKAMYDFRNREIVKYQ